MAKDKTRITKQIRSRLNILVIMDLRQKSELARLCGMSRPQFAQLLDGTRPNPTVETVGKVLAVLGRSWKDLDDPGPDPATNLLPGEVEWWLVR